MTNIIGHKKQWELLKRVAEGKKMPQAILFSGQNSLGKKKVALEFIKLLNCQEKHFLKRPCQACAMCNLIERGKHPDLIVVRSQKKEIQISQIRELQKALSLRPQLSNFKSVIVDEAETLRQEAQHCFLKTLEEPKGKVLFLLVSSHPEILFETIRSRCHILKFYKVAQEEIKKHFQKEAASPQFEEILRVAVGRPGVVFNLLAVSGRLKENLQWKKDILKMPSLDYAQRFQYAKELSEKPEQLSEILETWLRHFRDVLVSSCLPPEVKQSLTEESKNLPLQRLKNIIENLERILFLTSSTNINKKLALEILMLEL